MIIGWKKWTRPFVMMVVGFSLFFTGCDRAPEGMVRVPAGEFLMGTDEVDAEEKAMEFGIAKPWFEDEHPARQVKLPTYSIDRHETTNAQYREFVQLTGRRQPSDWVSGRYPAGKDQHPVVEVTWNDANAYCQWAGKRLPTEAEWEKAARGADGREYPWGNEFDRTKANINNQVGHTTPIGQYQEGMSPYGAHDMIGNVWEWTTDWYKPYAGNSYDSPRFGEQARVLRGNSFAGLGHYAPEDEIRIKAHYSRASYRLFMSPNRSVNDAGFRCVKSKS